MHENLIFEQMTSLAAISRITIWQKITRTILLRQPRIKIRRVEVFFPNADLQPKVNPRIYDCTTQDARFKPEYIIQYHFKISHPKKDLRLIHVKRILEIIIRYGITTLL